MHQGDQTLLYVADLCPGLTITHFYGTKETEKESESPVIEEAASLAEVVKKRRLLAAKAIEEKAQREREEAERLGSFILFMQTFLYQSLMSCPPTYQLSG